MDEIKRAAAILGRKGGQAKVPKGFAARTEEERSRIGKAAIAKRWAKKKGGKK